MNTSANPSSAPGVSAGYLLAAGMAAALWIGIGVILLPVMLVLALAHGLAAAGRIGLAGSHHRWLAVHHLWSAGAIAIVLIAPLLAVPALLSNAMTVFNTLLYAPHPIATLAAAWSTLDHGSMLAGAGLILFFSWFVVTFWISLRLLRRGLRWAEGVPAH